MRIIPRTNAFRRGTPPIRTDYIYVTNFWRETLARRSTAGPRR
ncbi:hypothetical protein I552_8752 [Mycobacterium xenopi 3993]|nr:hypothetical protein I552_8752 [Mycobacterium xenopi 3993]